MIYSLAKAAAILSWLDLLLVTQVLQDRVLLGIGG